MAEFDVQQTYGINDDDSPEKKIGLIVAAFQMMETAWSAFRRNQLRNYDYVYGKMIDDDVRKRLNDDGRPIFEFQLLKPIILYMAGKLARDGTKAKAIPIHEGFEEGAELHTILTNDWAMSKCLGYKEMSKAALDAYIGGFGYTNNYWTTKEDPEGSWVTVAMDPTSVMFDTICRDTIRQTDMKVISYSRMYSAEEIIEIFKDDIDDAIISKIRENAENFEGTYRSALGTLRGWYTRQWNASWNIFNRDEDSKRRQNLVDTFNDPKNGLYRIIEWHDKRNRSAKWLYDPVTRNKEIIPKDKENDREYIAQMVQQSPNSVIQNVSKEETWVTVIAPGLLPDAVIKEKPYGVQEQGFAIKVWTCENFHPDITRTQGGIDPLIAPCDLFNQKAMTAMELAMRTVNPDYEAEEESISPAALPAWKSKERGIMRFFKRGFNKPEPRQYQAGTFQMVQSLMELGLDLENKLSGVSPNARGYEESSKESGVLFEKRREQTEVMVSHFYDNIQETMMQSFNYCDANIQKFLTFERTIRVLQDTSDPMWLTVNQITLEGIKNDITQGEYDFRPDIEALGETQRQTNSMLMMGIAEKFAAGDPVLQMLILADLFKYQDIPNAKKYSKYCEQRALMLMQQLGMQQQMQEVGTRMALAKNAIDAIQQMHQPPPQKQVQGRKAA